jgi:hypothetical protein
VMPENFYERVLNYERQIDTLKENCPQRIVTTVTNLYQEAINYYCFENDVEKCSEL